MAQYYTSGAACKVLQVDKSTLKRLVDSGKLERVIPPTANKRGVYPKEAVDALAQQRHSIEIIPVEAISA